MSEFDEVAYAMAMTTVDDDIPIAVEALHEAKRAWDTYCKALAARGETRIDAEGRRLVMAVDERAREVAELCKTFHALATGELADDDEDNEDGS